MDERPRIAVFSGPTATIQNNAPLLTTNGSGGPLRAQRLAAPTVAYVEQFSGHPLEADAAELYGVPDGWLDEAGQFHALAEGSVLPEGASGVYRVELRPEDGPLLLPYLARTRDGEAWTSGGLTTMAPEDETRQTFFPDGSRLYEEIDRFGVDSEGRSGLLSSLADFEFVRAAPSGGYRREGEVRGKDYFFYLPPHLRTEPRPDALVRATNLVQQTLASGRFIGAQWLEGSPTTEESLYWFNLVIDTTVPLVGHSAQRQHGTVSADGDKNIWDGVRYLTSRVWADEEGRNRMGVVMLVDEVVYTAREVAKTDGRPGNYIAAGGHGGIVGSVGGHGAPRLTFAPMRKHTYKSEVRLSQLPPSVPGVRVEADGSLSTFVVGVRGPSGELAPELFPAVELVKFGRYAHECCGEAEVEGWLAHALGSHPLAGFVGEGKSPYGSMDPSQEVALKHAVFSGLPVVKAGRGNTGGFTYEQPPWFVKAGNLTATKARILLLASLLKLGALPPAADPTDPTPDETAATCAKVAEYQEIFDTH